MLNLYCTIIDCSNKSEKNNKMAESKSNLFNLVDLEKNLAMVSNLLTIKEETFIKPDGTSLVIRDKMSSLLSSIFPLNLDSVEVKASSVHGKGVFATKPIKTGEIITFYPGDSANYIPDGNEDKTDHLVICHLSNRVKKLTDCENTEETASNFYNKHWEYNCKVSDYYSITGHPELDKDPNYVGHLINDRYVCDFKRITPSIYLELSAKRTNAIFKNLKNNTHVSVVARRDIAVGEEIFVTYGIEYWSAQIGKST